MNFIIQYITHCVINKRQGSEFNSQFITKKYEANTSQSSKIGPIGGHKKILSNLKGLVVIN